jgi:hypothetical protein
MPVLSLVLIMLAGLFWLACLYAVPVCAVTWVWDGEITTGKSGVEQNIDDSKSSTGRAKQNYPDYLVFPLPIERYFEDFDPEEDDDASQTARQHTSPYSMVMIPRDWVYQGTPMPKGIYLVKLGAFNAGSLKTHRVWQPAPIRADNHWNLLHRLNNKDAQPPSSAQQLTLVLSQQGRVKAVLPVVTIQALTRQQRKQHPHHQGYTTYNPQTGQGHIHICGKYYQFSARLL